MKSDVIGRVPRRWAAVAAAAVVALMLFPFQASADPPNRSVVPYAELTASL